MQIYERYQHDPTFRSMVDMLCAYIEQGKFTPTETREAAMLAQIMFEERNPRPTFFTREQIMGGKV